MLELRPNCELCDRDLPPQSAAARICTYECTFCADCADTVLHDVCPNCGGNLQSRPIRPKKAWRPGLSLDHQPASEKRVNTRRSDEDIADHVARIRDIAPADR